MPLQQPSLINLEDVLSQVRDSWLLHHPRGGAVKIVFESEAGEEMHVLKIGSCSTAAVRVAPDTSPAYNGRQKAIRITRFTTHIHSITTHTFTPLHCCFHSPPLPAFSLDCSALLIVLPTLTMSLAALRRVCDSAAVASHSPITQLAPRWGNHRARVTLVDRSLNLIAAGKSASPTDIACLLSSYLTQSKHVPVSLRCLLSE